MHGSTTITPLPEEVQTQTTPAISDSLIDKARSFKHNDTFLAENEDKTHGAKTGISAAGARAALARVTAFYFRAPAKAFVRTRVDWTAYARAINPRVQANQGWSIYTTTPGILGYAVRTYGLEFLPKHVLPPLVANVIVGTVLYTTYLRTLSILHGHSYENLQRIFPPPPMSYTFAAGFIAGTTQSIVAAPLDALQVRFNAKELIDGRFKNMWTYASYKLHEIGVRGVGAGLGLSMVKDSFGFAVFFSTFEYVKSQCFYEFVTRYYGSLKTQQEVIRLKQGPEGERGVPTIKPGFAVEPTFLLLAGVSATVAQQSIQHPLSLVQELHYKRLEILDSQYILKPSPVETFRSYRHAYKTTMKHCAKQAMRAGGWGRWLYGGFVHNTLRQMPSTSAGLIVFELVRRMYADGSEAVRIEKDRYDILLT